MTPIEKIKVVESIRDTLIGADAVGCDAYFEPILCSSKEIYSIPAGYHVVVDFNKLAAAIYNAGFRKIDDQ